jgi:hypothetical protein
MFGKLFVADALEYTFMTPSARWHEKFRSHSGFTVAPFSKSPTLVLYANQYFEQVVIPALLRCI